jgi:hypothetical protein
MAEHERDEEIGRRYRELPREEPPRTLDEAILSAARRELETRPAPLVAPTGRRRWMVPVAAAAVIVLSAVVTLRIQREQPDLELATAPPPVAPPAASKDEKPAAPVTAQSAPSPERSQPNSKEAQVRRDKEAVGPRPERRKAERAPAPASVPAPAAPPAALADSAAQSKPAEAPAPAVQPEPRQAPAPAAAARPRAFAELDSMRSREALSQRAGSAEPPERMLERIAALRREGRHKEADDLYAEFRRRFPDYRIPEAMREQIAPR